MLRKIIVLGARGMAGQAFFKYYRKHYFDVLGISRSGPDLSLDFVTQYEVLEDVFIAFEPTVVINCAACVSLSTCEENPILSYEINSLFPRKLSISSYQHGFKLVHISTDHYYLFSKAPALHSEIEPVFLINNYAKSKYLGELYAAACNECLIVRTNITGFRNNISRPTFIAWLIHSIQDSVKIKLFTDFYTSTVDVATFCHYVHLLVEKNCSGVFNVASSESITKLQFAYLVAKEMSVELINFEEASVDGLHPKRASDLGLDCTKAESMLGVAMPSSKDVVHSLLQEYKAL